MGRDYASQIPREIVAVILEYEGGLVRAFQLDYIGGIYINVYRNALGWATTHGTGIEKYLLMANHIYSNKKAGRNRLKLRRMRKHMIPWKMAFQEELPILMKQMRKKALHVENEGPRSIIDLML